MAGVRHHILPKFLLKGFASRVEGKEKKKIYTWLYPKNGEPCEASIKKVGVEKHFYGKEGELCVDCDITNFESEYALLLDQLRISSIENEIIDQRIANLITHLVTRTKHIRDSYRESTEFLIDEILNNFLVADNIKKAILNNPDKMMDLIDEKLREYPTTLANKRMLRLLTPRVMPAFLDFQKDEMKELLRQHVKNIKVIAPMSIKEGHIKGLSQGLTPELRVKTYSALHWFLIETEMAIILGDIACLFEFIEGKKFRSIDFGDHKIKNIFLPISGNKLLLGTSLVQATDIDINLLNREIAKNSREFFISSQKSDDNLSLVPLIASDSDIMTKDEIDQIAKDVVAEFIKPNKIRRGGNGGSS